MLNDTGFDLWADSYDESVSLCEEAGQYPFAGYKNVLDGIYNRIRTKDSGSILDIGFGTGILTQKLYNVGYSISGIDFSTQMIETAKNKMPDAALYCHDFSHGLPEVLDSTAYDFIISTYAMHHIADDKKAEFIMELWNHLGNDGEILIGDIAFETRDKLNACKTECGAAWDEDEIYIVFDEIVKALTIGQVEFMPISYCAGIISIRKI